MLKKIPPPRLHQNVSYSVLTLNRKKLLITFYTDTQGVTIYIGGKNNLFCLETHVSFGYDDANLPHIDYDVICSIDNDFERGVDTNALLRFILEYIAVKYPHITGIRFSDSSNRVCNDRSVISLAEMGYITTGQTWYQRNFNAIYDEYSLIKFKKANNDFQTLKKEWSWEKTQCEIDFRPLFDRVSQDELENLYRMSATWQDFFGSISKSIGIAAFCCFASPWLHSFLHQYMRFTFLFADFRLPIPESPTLDITTSLKSINSPSQIGGGKKTRRNYRSRESRYFL